MQSLLRMFGIQPHRHELRFAVKYLAPDRLTLSQQVTWKTLRRVLPRFHKRSKALSLFTVSRRSKTVIPVRVEERQQAAICLVAFADESGAAAAEDPNAIRPFPKSLHPA
jgi:hypothetical protein